MSAKTFGSNWSQQASGKLGFRDPLDQCRQLISFLIADFKPRHWGRAGLAA